MRRLILPIVLLPALAWADGDAAAGKALYKQHCALCHGAQGQGVPPMFPGLVGKPPEAYAAMMGNYRAGHGHKVMVDMAKSLSDQQLADVLAAMRGFQATPAGK
ncbi:MAG: c-type cytochrome [Pseudomonadota bacterium]